jgi:peptidoglycan/xylan/chitin deacetylase (PgdA/CDA1 family)
MKLSIDDGCALDVRVAALASKYGIDCTFYWPVDWHSMALASDYEPLTWHEACQIAKDHEIGSHTITHRLLTRIDKEEAYYEIEVSKYMLEDMLGCEVNKFCPPRGYTNLELSLFTDQIYQSQRLTKGKHLVHIHPQSGANGGKHWLEAITDDTTELWGHSWEIDKFNLWEELEAYFERTHS